MAMHALGGALDNIRSPAPGDSEAVIIITADKRLAAELSAALATEGTIALRMVEPVREVDDVFDYRPAVVLVDLTVVDPKVLAALHESAPTVELIALGACEMCELTFSPYAWLPHDVPVAMLAVMLRSALAHHRLCCTCADLEVQLARRTEESHRLRAFNEEVIQSMGEGLAIEDAEDHLTFINPAGARMLGYEVEELIGCHLSAVVPPDQRVIVQAAKARRMQRQQDRYPVFLQRKDGSRLPVQIAAAPRLTDEGTFRGTISVFSDLTRQAQSEQALMHRLEMEHLVAELSTKLLNTAGGESLDDALRKVVSAIGDFTAVDVCQIGLFRRRGAQPEALYRWFSDAARACGLHTYSLIAGEFALWAEQLRAGEVVRYSTLSELPPTLSDARQMLEELGVCSLLAVPLTREDERWGALCVAMTTETRHWPEADVGLMVMVGEILSSALARQAAAERIRRQAARLAFVNELGRSLATTLDVREICRVAHLHLSRVLACPSMIITAYDAPSEQFALLYAIANGDPVDVGDLPSVSLDRDHGQHSRAVLDREPVIIEDLQTRERVLRTFVAATMRDASPPRAVLTVPMIVEHEVIGTVQVQDDQVGTYSEEDGQLLVSVANQIGLAIQNARLLERAREETRRLDEVMRSVPEGVVLVDPDGRVLLANPPGLAAIGALAGVGLGERLTELGGRPWRSWLTSPRAGLWHEIATQDAVSRIYELIARPVTRGAETMAWVMVLRDVTDARTIEAHAQQQARLAAVGQLAAGIAHDFNNIMAVIVLYAQMTQADEQVPKRLRERMGTVVEQARHASHLIDQLLDFSRSSRLEPQALDLAAFVKEQIKMLRRILPEHIRLDLNVGSDNLVVNVDATRVQQVVLNLAVNARDAMPEGGTLTLALDRLILRPGEAPPLPMLGAGAWVRLIVADTGVGISPEGLERVFDPFFTTKGPGEGTGLGLAQVHGIVKQHGGEIGVTSVVGQGTTFTICLPAQAVALQPETVLSNEEALPFGLGQTILVVEDNPATRASLVESLRSLHYRVLEAGDGVDALALLDARTEGVDLILSDLIMPEMGGKALAAALRDRGNTVPLLLLSGHSLGQDMRGLEELGVTAWAQKPVDLGTLAALVAGILGG